jgi:dTDP-glucose 4,6-dehydratase
MRILVTGGAGFIGSAVCRLIVSCGDEVLNFDKLSYAASLESLSSIAGSPKYQFIKGDIVNKVLLSTLFGDFEPEAVLHLAAETHVDRSIDDSTAFLESNVYGTHTLLEVARSYWGRLPRQKQIAFRFISVSTDEVYGSLGPDDPPFTEHTAYDPSSPYAASKAAADHLVNAWYRTYGLPVIISNCSNNFGPYQFPEKLIPLSILNALSGMRIAVYGTGSNIRDWLFVDDHARALVKILRHGRPGEKYNIGARSERSNLTVAELICQILDERFPDKSPHRKLINLVADRPGHDLRYGIDASKIEREIGWKPLESFESALRQTVEWYINNPQWWSPIRRNSYSGDRLGMTTSATVENSK